LFTTVQTFLRDFRSSASLLCRHLAFDDTNDRHEDGAAHPAAAHVGQDALQVETAAAGRRAQIGICRRN
jgi:hypothetical protein